MKLTTKELRMIIKEELEAVMIDEGFFDMFRRKETDISPEAEAALADRKDEVWSSEQSDEALKKISDLEIKAMEIWQDMDKAGKIEDSEYFNPIKSDPAGAMKDVLFLLDKTVAFGKLEIEDKKFRSLKKEDGELAVYGGRLEWENKQFYGDKELTSDTFFDEDKWAWEPLRQVMDDKSDYDPY